MKNRSFLATLVFVGVALGLMAAGVYTNGLNQLEVFSGQELAPFDTQIAGGANPQSGSVSVMQLATAVKLLNNSIDKTTVAGTRYYVSYPIQTPFQSLTGIEVLIGSTGGTDNWLVELHDPTGALVATSATAGALVGTAATWQQFAFTSAYTPIVAGTYYLTVQSNGITAKLATYEAPAVPVGTMVTGSATGTFGTGAAIATPSKTYTQNLGPVALPYQ